MFDQFVILSRSGEREEAAVCLSVCLKDEGCHSKVWSRQQRDREDFPESDTVPIESLHPLSKIFTFCCLIAWNLIASNHTSHTIVYTSQPTTSK